ncbi:MAG: HAD-IC family P-type ATPase [Woeseiaceae bacterium]|nr:HAD-IC family P-type ATPase [Gammaproteobacteria bacterium]NNK26352.1 HAD-IC family P-type ATPase [Woeseiaceae bacterium]
MAEPKATAFDRVASAADREWFAMPLPAVLDALGGTADGLGDDEAARRLAEHGPNILPRRKPPTLFEILLRQFRNPLIYLLGIAAGVSIAIGEVKDAAFILGVVIINAIIGTVQEVRAERASEALQKLLRIRAAVRRSGRILEVDAESLVPGDVLYLESGNRVPADIRLIAAKGLEVDESLLTGESVPVLKNADWSGAPDTVLADRLNMLHAGAMVSTGRCHGMVTATGAETAVGRLALDVMQSGGGRPPLVERMEKFTHRIALAVLFAATGIAVMGVALGRYEITEMFMFGIALAVSAIPEGLPVALTVALAIGTTRMARRGVIVRRLAAVEGLGSCTLIASDKTGTLTCNELTVQQVRTPDGRVFHVTGEGFTPEGQFFEGDTPIGPDQQAALGDLARAVTLCNEAELLLRENTWVWRGDPTDVALLTMACKLGWNREASEERHPEVNEIPFEPERQFAATFNRDGEEVRTFVKGAPERVLTMLAPDEGADALLATARDMAEAGYRVLAVAHGPAPADLAPSDTPPAPESLTCLGLVGMIDPLRPDVREAIAEAQDAGVKTVMVTGDHPLTALAIARDLGLATRVDEVITGADLVAAPPESLPDLISRTRVFARVAPHQKLEIVNAARATGHFVAVTGDGINDAPALKAANIGVAMGKSGTDVAREAAELVISDDHFGTITNGIEEGRIAYNNIRNVIYLLISTGAAEVVLVTLALLFGSPIPLLPVQLLWLNLVTNGIQDVALAFEPGIGDERRSPPRPPRESIFNRLMIERTLVAALFMGIVGFGLFQWCLAAGWSEAAARNALLMLMVLYENFHLMNCRSETRSAFLMSPLRSPVLMVGVVAAFSIHVAMTYLPIGNRLLTTEPIDGDLWLVLLALSLPILLIMELHKLSWAVRQRRAA